MTLAAALLGLATSLICGLFYLSINYHDAYKNISGKLYGVVTVTTLMAISWAVGYELGAKSDIDVDEPTIDLSDAVMLATAAYWLIGFTILWVVDYVSDTVRQSKDNNQ